MTFDGSGTITGLAAGGLPNGAVTADDLAAGAARANFGAGAVLQVVNATYSTQSSTTSGSYVDTGLTASITPSSSSSKILVIVHQTGIGKNSGGGSYRIALNLLRASTQLTQFEIGSGYTSTSLINIVGGTGVCYLDSPSTTSSITYKTQYKGFDGGQVFTQYDGSTSSITLMEIAG